MVDAGDRYTWRIHCTSIPANYWRRLLQAVYSIELS